MDEDDITAIQLIEEQKRLITDLRDRLLALRQQLNRSDRKRRRLKRKMKKLEKRS